MSKLTEAYRTIGVFNAYEFADGNVFIDYSPQTTGRGSMSATWQVCKGDEQTDPKAAWYYYGRKTFIVCRRGNASHAESKAERLAEAIKWASGKYGVKKWARTPYGSWMDADFVKTRLAELASKLKADD